MQYRIPCDLITIDTVVVVDTRPKICHSPTGPVHPTIVSPPHRATAPQFTVTVYATDICIKNMVSVFFRPRLRRISFQDDFCGSP